jgi:PKD repeat protein
MLSAARTFALVAVAAAVATAGCTVHDAASPSLSGPSQLALTLSLNAIPDSISQDGGSQSSIKITAIGPDGQPLSALPLRIDMSVNGQPGDFGTLSARTLVTNSSGVATVTYTAPPSPSNGVFGTCQSLPGTCVTIVATATSTNFVTANPQSVQIRLVPPGVILPPAQAPVASFVFSPPQPAANSPVQFDASASCGGPLTGSNCPGTRSITSYAWNFGDGTTGSGQTASHSFALQQTYTVTLTVTNDLGASSSTPRVVSVGGGSLPTATFTISPAAPGVGETVFFNGLTSTPGQGHTISSYRWTFGDGASGSGATVSHAYLTAGTYSVQLTVTDDSGQSATSGAQTITVGSPPAPSANFTFSPATPAVLDTVVFDWRTTTTAQGQTIVSLDWNFGDSTPIVHCPGDPACTSQGITTHQFAFTGTFTVNLVVTDSAGRTNAKATSVTVVSGNPIPTCTASPSTVTAGGIVLLSARNTQTFSGATITSYSWNFGDGTSGNTGPDVNHQYNLPTGSKTVLISVIDSLGRSCSGTCTVTVQ